MKIYFYDISCTTNKAIRAQHEEVPGFLLRRSQPPLRAAGIHVRTVTAGQRETYLSRISDHDIDSGLVSRLVNIF